MTAPEPDPAEASTEDLHLAIIAIGGKSRYGGLLSCALAGIYAERERHDDNATPLHPAATPSGRAYLAGLLTAHPTPEVAQAVAALLRGEDTSQPLIEYAIPGEDGWQIPKTQPQAADPEPDWVTERLRTGGQVGRRVVMVVQGWQIVTEERWSTPPFDPHGPLEQLARRNRSGVNR